jgi:hypothetical protein
MAQLFLGRSDGRLFKAFTSVHKLVALGFTDEQVLARLIRLYRRWLAWQARRRGRKAKSSGEAGERLEQAQAAVRWMLATGFSESEVAAFVGVQPCTIAHLLSPREPRALSQTVTKHLLRAMREIGGERLDALMSRMAVRVVDTCNPKGVVVDEETLVAVAASARHLLRNCLTRSSAQVPAVAGIPAFLAEIGDQEEPIFLIGRLGPRASTTPEKVESLRRMEHEAEHLVTRLRGERLELERNLPPHPTPPAGRIA